MLNFGDVHVEVGADYVAQVEIRRPPTNFFDIALLSDLAQAYETLDDDPACRALLLCSQGKHFCAGAQFTAGVAQVEPSGGAAGLYREALRLFRTRKPVVAAVQGGAIGGGLGLALSADFRIGEPSSRFTANFARLGFHHGFGLTVTLPGAVGQQAALELLYTGRRIDGQEAHRLGLIDQLAEEGQSRAAARALAGEIARSAPLAVQSIRQTMRGTLPVLLEHATKHEGTEQIWLRGTEDFQEGLKASADRRIPLFSGR